MKNKIHEVSNDPDVRTSCWQEFMTGPSFPPIPGISDIERALGTPAFEVVRPPHAGIQQDHLLDGLIHMGWKNDKTIYMPPLLY
ncbi:hypothetical protein B6U90_00030 [Thermoplasmatales archaeon ex4484_6]|nr:MAG: hypothetical protein B6U90_00030 [Thermoplasmatales archaeon ex4484_6]